MQNKMTTRERMQRIFEHREADRIPIIDYAWSATVERWEKEGLPSKDYVSFLGMDKVRNIWLDTSPRFEYELIEETDRYVIGRDEWGATQKNFKHTASTPEHIDFYVKSRKEWQVVKDRMTPSPDRINWADLDKNFKEWRKEGAWINASFWFGFDVTHSRLVGTEQFLMYMLDDPEWCVEIFNHYLDMCIALFEDIWEKGYKFDAISWPDDMGFKYNQFFSLNTYRELLKPVQKRAVDWAHEKGIKACLHSCGDINPFLPELLDIGIDCLNPLEVKAGMNPYEIKQKYGDKLVLHGGIDALLLNKGADAFIEEMEKLIPEMKKNGGYIFATDHSIPSCISLDDFQRIINRAMELGSY